MIHHGGDVIIYLYSWHTNVNTCKFTHFPSVQCVVQFVSAGLRIVASGRGGGGRGLVVMDTEREKGARQ
jgi:hypothetical protein